METEKTETEQDEIENFKKLGLDIVSIKDIQDMRKGKIICEAQLQVDISIHDTRIFNFALVKKTKRSDLLYINFSICNGTLYIYISQWMTP